MHIGLNPIGLKEGNVSTSGLHCLAIHEVKREKNLTKEMVFNLTLYFTTRSGRELKKDLT